MDLVQWKEEGYTKKIEIWMEIQGERKKLGWVREDRFLGMRRKMMKFTF
jgi:hypothetical protein